MHVMAWSHAQKMKSRRGGLRSSALQEHEGGDDDRMLGSQAKSISNLKLVVDTRLSTKPTASLTIPPSSTPGKDSGTSIKKSQ